MGAAMLGLEAMEWSSIELPFAYRLAALALDENLQGHHVQQLARGFVENREALAALTDQSMLVSEAGAFRANVSTWPLEQLRSGTSHERDRVLVELVAPGRRMLLRLRDEAPSRDLVRAVEERLNPTPQATFRRYVAKA